MMIDCVLEKTGITKNLLQNGEEEKLKSIFITQ